MAPPVSPVSHASATGVSRRLTTRGDTSHRSSLSGVSSSLDLGQLGDDEKRKGSIAAMLSLSTGFSGWTAKVVAPGRVRTGFTIAKRDA